MIKLNRSKDEREVEDVAFVSIEMLVGDTCMKEYEVSVDEHSQKDDSPGNMVS